MYRPGRLWRNSWSKEKSAWRYRSKCAAQSASACTERACTMGYGFTTNERTDEIEGCQRTRESLSTKQQRHACTNPLPWNGPASVLVDSIPLPNTTTSCSSSSASCSTRSSYIGHRLDEY